MDRANSWSLSNHHGTTLLEVLVAIAITGMIVLFLATAVSTIQKRVSYLALTIEDRRRLQLAEATLSQAIRTQDMHVVDMGVRIHSMGNITLSNGALNPVAHSKFPPLQNSQAITYMQPLSALPLILEAFSVEGDHIGLTACALGALNESLRDVRSYLAIGLDGRLEIFPREVQYSFRESRPCIQGNFLVRESMLFVRPLAIGIPHLLIALKAVSTIYLDQNGTLRHLGHEGERNIENQPIVSGLKDVRIALEREAATLVLGIEVVSITGNRHKRDTRAAIARGSLINLLFNTP